MTLHSMPVSNPGPQARRPCSLPLGLHMDRIRSADPRSRHHKHRPHHHLSAGATTLQGSSSIRHSSSSPIFTLDHRFDAAIVYSSSSSLVAASSSCFSWRLGFPSTSFFSHPAHRSARCSVLPFCQSPRRIAYGRRVIVFFLVEVSGG
ncbi:hypothetical protein PIB30_058255 [Stylosanthes scabra]|uniref:Uncharacterized protein n=1 Tax=Stylosanthes scabra TaxID=79078 RepID=A0ABU6YHE3_9FABA|nr:hypothetical protein [Stylosanthes scabra]